MKLYVPLFGSTHLYVDEFALFSTSEAAFIDLFADPNERLRLQQKIRDYAGGSASPATLQNLPVGKAIVKTAGFNYGAPGKINRCGRTIHWQAIPHPQVSA